MVLYDDYADEAVRMLELLEHSEIGLVMLSDDSADYLRLAATTLRGWACLRKEADGHELAGAIHAVAAGLIVLDRTLSDLLTAGAPIVRPRQPSAGQGAGEALTAREEEVLQLMALGLPNKQIGGRLSISLSTVKFHVASILGKLNASSRTEAVTMGARQGLVSL